MVHPNYKIKLWSQCINLGKNPPEIKIQDDLYNIYQYIIDHKFYINKDDPEFIKFILSIPGIEFLKDKELRNIVDSRFIFYLKNIKKDLINLKKSPIYAQLNKYMQQIIEIYLYNSIEEFCKFLVDIIKDETPMEIFRTTIQFLWDHDIIVTHKNAKNFIKEIRSCLK